MGAGSCRPRAAKRWLCESRRDALIVAFPRRGVAEAEAEASYVAGFPVPLAWWLVSYRTLGIIDAVILVASSQSLIGGCAA